LHAVRVAARIRRELGTEVDMVHSHSREFKVLVDGETIIDAGPLAAVGIVPSDRKVMEAVRARFSGAPHDH
jgi:hypothetical protein